MMEILIVEDDFVARGFLEKTLNSLGHECLLAEDGLQAWEIFQKNNVRIVITDWAMPNMDGLTLCQKIRETKSSSYVYLILLTARDTKKDAIEGFQAGIDDYIVKPFDPEELRARIRAGERIIQLEDEYKRAQAQLLQSEKMASVGQLAAGVAHEINNPAGFVSSNLRTLSDYQKDIVGLMKEYKKLVEELEDRTADNGLPPSVIEQTKRILGLEKEIDVEFLLEDIMDLIGDCKEGTSRIKKIVLDLKDFAHPGEDKVQSADINKGIESTLNVIWNELKYKAKVAKEYGDLPLVKCYAHQLNQVFMNLLVNAAQAMEKQGEIKISTRADNGYVEIDISDNGTGIPEENLSRIFDPFFTTKDVGKGTGLGLNMAYNIIKKHEGTIDVESTVGRGTTFSIRIPMGE
ncbi:MAG: response regulator [Thermodesulfobacteriota bacterium]|nr:response regulator [Thermodesulfobacteriota bacterium]